MLFFLKLPLPGEHLREQVCPTLICFGTRDCHFKFLSCFSASGVVIFFTKIYNLAFAFVVWLLQFPQHFALCRRCLFLFYFLLSRFYIIFQCSSPASCCPCLRFNKVLPELSASLYSWLSLACHVLPTWNTWGGSRKLAKSWRQVSVLQARGRYSMVF